MLLTDRATQELESRAAQARDVGDEGLAAEIELMRDVLASWSELSAEVLRTIEVEQPVPAGVEAATDLRDRFLSTADPRDAASAAKAWLEVVGSPGFDALPMGARAAYLFECSDACSAAYGAAAEPEFLEDLLATVDRVINTPIPRPAQPGALVRWGKALAMRYWAYNDPADARKALAVFRRSYESAPRDREERSLNLCHYAQWLRACAIAARRHIAPLDGVRWDAWLAQAADVLRAELATAREAAIGPLAYELALCLADQGEGSDAAALTEALDLAQRAAAEQMTYPQDRLGVRTLIARLGGELNELTGEGDPEDVNRQFSDAVSEAASLSPDVAVGVARSWGEWALRQSRPADAVAALEAGIRAGNAIIARQVSWQDREIWLEYPQSLTPDLALALVLTGQRERAIEVLENGRRGSLAEGLRDIREERRDLARAHPELCARLDRARAALRSAVLLGAAPDSGSTTRPSTEARGLMRTARQALADIEAEIREVVPGYGRPLSYAQIAETVTDQPLVYLASSAASGLVLLIDPETKDVCCEIPGDLRSEALLEPLAAYIDAAGATGAPGGERSAGRGTADWRKVLESTADWLGEVLLAPLLRITGTATAVRVAPVGFLGLLPIHLARRADTSAPTGYRYLMDDRSVSVLPSVTYMPGRGGGGDRPSTALSAAIIEAWDFTLTGAREEARAVAAVFGPRARLLPPAQASRDSMLAALRGAEVAHVACHGMADPLRPLDSALLLGGSERITVRDLMADPGFTPRLVVLSACQSAMSGVRLPDEAVSLPTALLQAGADATIGSLWAVPDAPTALLMARFYQLWQGEGYDPPEALRLAQIWLRDSPNAEHASRFASLDLRRARVLPDAVQDWDRRRGYAHPDCWAGFVFTGAWRPVSSLPD